MLSDEPSLNIKLSVFSELYSGFHIKAKKPNVYKSYLDWVNDAVIFTKKREFMKDIYVYMEDAKNICSNLTKIYDKKMLLHMDIYDHNIVSDKKEYRLIDPKGIIGDPIFEIGQFIFSECCKNGVQPQKIEIIFNNLEELLNIAQTVLRQCFYVETLRFVCGEMTNYGIDCDDIEKINFAKSVLNAD